MRYVTRCSVSSGRRIGGGVELLWTLFGVVQGIGRPGTVDSMRSRRARIAFRRCSSAPARRITAQGGR